RGGRSGKGAVSEPRHRILVRDWAGIFLVAFRRGGYLGGSRETVRITRLLRIPSHDRADLPGLGPAGAGGRGGVAGWALLRRRRGPDGAGDGRAPRCSRGSAAPRVAAGGVGAGGCAALPSAGHDDRRAPRDALRPSPRAGRRRPRPADVGAGAPRGGPLPAGHGLPVAPRRERSAWVGDARAAARAAAPGRG